MKRFDREGEMGSFLLAVIRSDQEMFGLDFPGVLEVRANGFLACGGYPLAIVIPFPSLVTWDMFGG